MKWKMNNGVLRIRVYLLVLSCVNREIITVRGYEGGNSVTHTQTFPESVIPQTPADSTRSTDITTSVTISNETNPRPLTEKVLLTSPEPTDRPHHATPFQPASDAVGTVVIIAICLVVGGLAFSLAVLIYKQYRDMSEGRRNPSNSRAVTLLFKQEAGEYENDSGHHRISRMSVLYESVEPNATQPSEVYQNLNQNTTQPIYLDPNIVQLDAVYQNHSAV